MCYNIYKGNRTRNGAVATRGLYFYNHSAVRQGDYFFPFVIASNKAIIKEISVRMSIPNPIIKDIA